MMSFRHNRLAAFTAILAIALQALWPLVAQAKPRIPGELVPICTVAGVTHYLELPAGKFPLDERSSTHHEHCTLCVFGTDRSAVLPHAPLPPVVAGDACDRAVAHSQSSSLQSPSHAPALPRAPPALS